MEEYSKKKRKNFVWQLLRFPKIKWCRYFNLLKCILVYNKIKRKKKTSKFSFCKNLKLKQLVFFFNLNLCVTFAVFPRILNKSFKFSSSWKFLLCFILHLSFSTEWAYLNMGEGDFPLLCIFIVLIHVTTLFLPFEIFLSVLHWVALVFINEWELSRLDLKNININAS